MILFEVGVLYAAGLNHDGRRGTAVHDEDLLHFYEVTFTGSAGEEIDTFKDIAATWESSIFVTLDDQVYTSGSGSKGELGHGEIFSQLSKPTLLPGFPPENTSIKSIAACMGHVVTILSDDRAYGWGAGRKGQLGEPKASIMLPRQISDSTGWCEVVCGRDFTCLFGEPQTGQFVVLGDDRWGVRSCAPTSLASWTTVAASWASIFVLLKTGDVVSWGRNDHGQLAPTGLPKLTAIAAGSEHAVGETDDGVIAWGWGEHGNCGEPTNENGDVRDRWNILVLKASSRVLGAGCATSFTTQQNLDDS